MKSRFKVAGCTALITGASSGLGVAFASYLSSRASQIILVARRNVRLEAMVDFLAKSSPNLHVKSYPADLSIPSERERLVAWIINEKIHLNLLINNAGLGDLGSFKTAEWSRLSSIMDVNIVALTHLTHLLLPVLRNNTPAGILNVSSVAGYYPLPNMAVYAATKAYVTSFSEALRMELAREGIHLTVLCPGSLPTEFFTIASRKQKIVQASDRSYASLITSPHKVAQVALLGLEADLPEVIPNRLLSILIVATRLIPFPIQRIAIRLGLGNKK